MVTFFDTAALEAEFDGLSKARQCTEWLSYIDALDRGDVGQHRFGLVLQPRWERDEHASLTVKGAGRRRRLAAGTKCSTEELDTLYGVPAF